MVLVTHHTQSSAAAPLRNSSWSRGIRLRQNIVRFQMNLQMDRCISFKQAFPLRLVPRFVYEAKEKSLQISSFKGNIHNDNTRDSSCKPTTPKSSVKISFLPHEREENLLDSPLAQDMSVSCASETNGKISQSHTIRGLFLKWLSLIQTGQTAEAGDDILERPPQMDQLTEQKATKSMDRGEILKKVLCYFVGLDATITVPLLIFIPLYLAVNMKYGGPVSRELTPLWILGPLVVALYIKLLWWIFALYVFSFKQSVKLIRNLPTYYSIALNYVADGKLNEDIQARFWLPIINIKNLEYKEFTKRKSKVLREWMVEKYLDFVESIWPHYCRTIRFLKRANLI